MHKATPDLIQRAKERGVENVTELRYEHFQTEMNLINKAYYTIIKLEGDATVNHLHFQFQR